MGIPAAQALSSVRFSLGWATQAQDVSRLGKVLPELVLRARTPDRASIE